MDLSEVFTGYALVLLSN